MNRRILLVMPCIATLAACTGISTAIVASDLNAAKVTLKTLLASWPIDKGLLMVGAQAFTLAGQPVVAAGLNASISAIDPLVAQAEATILATDTTVAEIQALGVQISALVAAAKIVAASKITVVAS